MLVLPSLSALAVIPLLKNISEGMREYGGERTASQVANYLMERFSDGSKLVPQALERSGQQAWRTFEVALAGESLWTWLDRGDNKSFRQEVRLFLEETQQTMPNLSPDFRKTCLTELRTARKANHLMVHRQADDTARQAASFARFHNPNDLVEAEWQLIGRMATTLHDNGYPNLSQLLQQRPAKHGPAFLAIAVRFFFRREVETNSALFQGLVYEQMDQLGQSLTVGFHGVHKALTEQGQQLEQHLSSLHIEVREMHEAVLDVRAEVRKQGQEHRDLYQQVLKLHQRLDMSAQEIRSRDSFSIRNDEERRLVKQLIKEYRALPQSERNSLPALLNAIGKLEVASGDFAAASQDFAQVSTLVQAPDAKGEAHWNAYLSFLEQGKYADAQKELVEAVRCDSKRFAPFPLKKYRLVRILGAGGFGVTFQCKYIPTNGNVAIKSLMVDGLGRDVNVVFEEAGMLDGIHHPAIAQLRECDFVDDKRTRPYLVMDYFDGVTLEEHVKRHGPMSVQNFLDIAKPVAEALKAAHDRSILHRDIKPANLLVRCENGAWQIKVIDFGLAMKQQLLSHAGSTTKEGKTVLGASIAGTIDYAAPEQMGKLPGTPISPASDIYGFGKTCCYALFQTPMPMRSHWKAIPDALAELIEHCLLEHPKHRLKDFSQVLKQLERVQRKLPKDRSAEPSSVLILSEVLEPVPPQVVTPPPITLYAAPEPEIVTPTYHTPPPLPTPPPIPRQQLHPPREDWYEEEDEPDTKKRTGVRYRLPVLLSGFLGCCFSAFLLTAGIWLGYLKQHPDGEDAMYGALVCGGITGLVCGMIVRSVRGWLFVLISTAVLTGLMMSPEFRTRIDLPINPDNDEHPIFILGVMSLFAWVLALPVKLFMAIFRL